MLSFAQLFQQLQDLDEHETIEAKRGSDVGRSLLETVCAFANEPNLGGGHILLGVTKDESSLFPSYAVEGIERSDKLQADLASQLRSTFNVNVSAQITAERYDGKVVIVVHVPEVHPNDKPVYFRSKGLPRGAYRRNGSADVECTEDDLQVFYRGRETESYDFKVLDDTGWEDVDPDAVVDYRKAMADRPDSLVDDDRELLRSLRCVKIIDGSLKLTLAGLLLFGKSAAQRRCLPMTRVDYIRVPGREWAQDPDKKFITTERRGPLVRLAGQVWSDVLDDVPRAFNIPSGNIQRSEEPLVPDRVVREAVVNALMHRDYRVNSPIQIIRYSNRLEFRNPGYSLKSEDLLGQPGSETRNPCVAAVLYEMRLAETKGRGFAIMRERMERAGLSPPPFESSRKDNRFALFLLFHHLLSEADLQWLARFDGLHLTDEERQTLVVTRELGAIDNQVFRYISGADTPIASRSLRRLREAGLLEARGKGSGTYYVPTPKLLEGSGSPPDQYALSPKTSIPARESPAALSGGVTNLSAEVPPSLSEGVTSLSEGVGSLYVEVPSLSEEVHTTEPDVDPSYTETWGPITERLRQLPKQLRRVPPELLSRIEGLGKRANPTEVRSTVLALCAWRPLSADHLSRILGRDQRYITEKYLSPMIERQELEYTIPDIPNHMNQGYRLPKLGNPARSGGET